MQCPKCNTENPEDARFCLKCGEEVALVCPECGRELPPHAEFCISCGAKLAEAPAEAPEAAPDVAGKALKNRGPEFIHKRSINIQLPMESIT